MIKPVSQARSRTEEVNITYPSGLERSCECRKGTEGQENGVRLKGGYRSPPLGWEKNMPSTQNGVRTSRERGGEPGLLTMITKSRKGGRDDELAHLGPIGKKNIGRWEKERVPIDKKSGWD